MGPDTTTQLHFFVSIVLALLLGVAVGIAMQEDQLVSMIRTVPGGAALSKSSSKRPLLHVLSRNGNYRLDAEPALDQRPAPLRQKRAYVRIHLKEGLIYEGWPHQYSHGKASSEILLTPACRVSGDPPTAALLRGPGVVVMEPEIRAIEFLDLATSQCRHLVDAL